MGDGLDRRRLLKAGAWSVPVIAIAVSAPLAAASGNAKVVVDTFRQDGVQTTWVQGAGNVFVSMKGAVQFRLEWNSPESVTSATLQLSIPAAGLKVDGSGKPVAPAVSGTGWSFVSVSITAGVALFTFQFSGNVAPNRSSSTLSYTIYGDSVTAKSAVFPKTANGTLTGNFPSVPKSITWT